MMVSATRRSMEYLQQKLALLKVSAGKAAAMAASKVAEMTSLGGKWSLPATAAVMAERCLENLQLAVVLETSATATSTAALTHLEKRNPQAVVTPQQMTAAAAMMARLLAAQAAFAAAHVVNGIPHSALEGCGAAPAKEGTRPATDADWSVAAALTGVVTLWETDSALVGAASKGVVPEESEAGPSHLVNEFPLV